MVANKETSAQSGKEDEKFSFVIQWYRDHPSQY
jgi:hypothetical protein